MEVCFLGLKSSCRRGGKNVRIGAFREDNTFSLCVSFRPENRCAYPKTLIIHRSSFPSNCCFRANRHFRGEIFGFQMRSGEKVSHYPPHAPQSTESPQLLLANKGHFLFAAHFQSPLIITSLTLCFAKRTT